MVRQSAMNLISRVIGGILYAIFGGSLVTFVLAAVDRWPRYVNAAQTFLVDNRLWVTAAAVLAFAGWGLIVHYPKGAAAFAVLGYLFGDGLTGWGDGDPIWEAALVCAFVAVAGILFTRSQIRDYRRLLQMSRGPALSLHDELRRDHALTKRPAASAGVSTRSRTPGNRRDTPVLQSGSRVDADE